MQELITRNFVNQQIQYYDGENLRTIKDFNDEINFWKIIFYEGYGLRPGNIVSFFDASIRFSYTTAFLAAAELGLVMLTPPEKATDDTGRTTKLDKMLGASKIDLSLIDDDCAEIPHISAMANYYSKTVASTDIIRTYTIKDPALYKEISEKIFPAPTDVLVLSTTSGSTGEPKFVNYTHQQLSRIAHRNARLFGFDGQRVCHTRNMHHGFVLMCNFLPSLCSTATHHTYVLPPAEQKEEFSKFVQFIKDHQISKLISTNKPNLDEIIDDLLESGPLEHSMDIVVGGFYLTHSYVNRIRESGINSIVALFASNETFGPVLLRTVTANTDLATYQNNFVGVPGDDFYQIELVNGHLNVRCPALYPNAIEMGDMLIGDNVNGYVHQGRANFFRINEVDFTVSELTELLKPFVTGEFTVVPDLTFQKLYLVLWNQTIADVDSINIAMENKYGLLKFNGIDNLPSAEYNQSFKLDYDLLRAHFRKHG